MRDRETGPHGPRGAGRAVQRAVRQAIREMHRQVGDLELGADDLAVRGVLVRHLVMPAALEETAAILEWLARTVGPDTYVNVMAQYHPDGRVLREPGRWPALERRVTRAEHARAVAAARTAGLHRIDGVRGAARR